MGSGAVEGVTNGGREWGWAQWLCIFVFSRVGTLERMAGRVLHTHLNFIDFFVTFLFGFPSREKAIYFFYYNNVGINIKMIYFEVPGFRVFGSGLQVVDRLIFAYLEMLYGLAPLFLIKQETIIRAK